MNLSVSICVFGAVSQFICVIFVWYFGRVVGIYISKMRQRHEHPLSRMVPVWGWVYQCTVYTGSIVYWKIGARPTTQQRKSHERAGNAFRCLPLNAELVGTCVYLKRNSPNVAKRRMDINIYIYLVWKYPETGKMEINEGALWLSFSFGQNHAPLISVKSMSAVKTRLSTDQNHASPY